VSLNPGTRLGPYAIVAPLGAGGMGEVYRATDSNLKRSVAIKVLPAPVAADADRLARFQREAEVLSRRPPTCSSRHFPHRILTIDQYAVSDDGQRFLFIHPRASTNASPPVTVVVNWAAGFAK
jgi:serine/threonine protein kinase